MKKIAQFFKVSYEQFEKDCRDIINTNNNPHCDYLMEIYNNLILPKRATIGSAGYDFFIPFTAIIKPNETITIPTGIRCKMNDGWVLKIYPRSGLGFKFRLQLNNTVGIIDGDYYFSSNEGHIMVRLTNDTNQDKTIELVKNTGFVQGIFLEYGITIDDSTENIRDGGFGSTTNKGK